MDAEDLAKAALSAIDDWLDEEIVGFEPEEGVASATSPRPSLGSFVSAGLLAHA